MGQLQLPMVMLGGVTQMQAVAKEVERRLAQRLKSARSARGLNLADVANSADLSVGYLSRLEGGVRQPSIGTLVVLSRVLKVSLTELLSDQPESTSAIIRNGSRETHVRPEGKYIHVSNTLADTNIDVVRISLVPDARRVEMKNHPGEEWLYVLSGTVKLELGADEFELRPGDAAHFQASEPHRMAAVAGPAEVLLNITALSRNH